MHFDPMKILASALLWSCLGASNLVFGNELNGPSGDSTRAVGFFVTATGTQSGLDNEVTATFTLTGTVDDGDGNDIVAFQIFDDLSLVGSATVSVPVGQSQAFTRTIVWTGPIGAGATGVGLYLIDTPGTTTLSYVDPFVFGDLPLSLSKSAPATADAGDQITYTITYGNPTPTPRNNVMIRDIVPTGTTFVSATDGGTAAGIEVRWNIGTLAANTTGQTVQFTVNVTAAPGSQVVNQTYSIRADDVPALRGVPTTTVVSGPVPIASIPVPILGLPGLLALLSAIVVVGLVSMRRF